MSDPIPYCLKCDEPLNWCIHGDGSGWATADVPDIQPGCGENE